MAGMEKSCSRNGEDDKEGDISYGLHCLLVLSLYSNLSNGFASVSLQGCSYRCLSRPKSSP
jgi:hypothetical protein